MWRLVFLRGVCVCSSECEELLQLFLRAAEKLEPDCVSVFSV